MHGWREERIGASRRGVDIVAHVPAALGSEAAAGLLVAALHGEEPEALQVARRVLERVPGTRTRWVVVACANPDGVLAATRQNAAGVDLNRNFPSRSWSDAPSFTYPPGTTIRRRPYRTNRSSPGATPGSEPEVQALLALVARLRPALIVDVHAPLALIAPTPDAPPATVAALAEASGLPVHPEIGSPTPGALRDWCGDAGQACITYEVEHAPLPALLGRHVPALASLLDDGSAPAHADDWATAVALRHHGATVARIVRVAASGRAHLAAVDARALEAARRATVLARVSADVPATLPDSVADARLEDARVAADITWQDFRETRAGWEVVLADGSVRPVHGPVEVDGDAATWSW